MKWVYEIKTYFANEWTNERTKSWLLEKDEEVWQGSLSSTSTQIKIDVIYFSLNEFTLIFRITHAISFLLYLCDTERKCVCVRASVGNVVSVMHINVVVVAVVVVVDIFVIVACSLLVCF